MRRKLFCMVMLLTMLAQIRTQAFAASGKIRIDIGGAGEVTLYRVGILERENYRLSDEHGGGEATFDDVLRPELALWLASRATGGVSRESVDGIAVFSGLSEGLYLAVQTEKTDGDGEFEPFLITLPWDGDTWILDIKPQKTSSLTELPKTGDRSFIVVSSWIMCASMIGLLVIGSRKKY